MAIFFPISAALIQAGSMTMDKIVLSIKKVTYKNYMGISFPLIFLFTLIIFLIFRPELNLHLLKGKYIFFLIAMIALVIITNLLYYRALKKDLLSEMQTISLLRGIPLIIFAAIIFPMERNYLIIALSVIALIAIIWSHYEHNHFKISKKTLPFLIWILTLAPLTGILNKFILEIWSPITMQLVTDGIIVLILTPLFFKDIKTFPKKGIPLILLINFLTSIAWILYFFSYQVSGIIYTVLIFSLQPILVYLASLIFLKEKINYKKLIAFIIIIAVIIISQVFK
ncbi:EamA family transporter [Candidatus Pacearchaeota archaeon]|nr:EamA family transporter [Candidatus Pacearchaeota archaeon]